MSDMIATAQEKANQMIIDKLAQKIADKVCDEVVSRGEQRIDHFVATQVASYLTQLTQEMPL